MLLLGCGVATYPIFSMGISHTSSSMLPPAVPAGWRIKAGFGPRLYISAHREYREYNGGGWWWVWVWEAHHGRGRGWG